MVENYPQKVQNEVTNEDILKKTQNLSGTYLFFSLDLVNSTFYKNQTESWANLFWRFFQFCKDTVNNNDFPKARLWKMIGDEILFYMPVTNLEELYEMPEKVFRLMNESVKKIHIAPNAKGILSVKGTLWAAYAEDTESKKTNEKDGNVIIKNWVNGGLELDFLGPDIDIGFRISNFSLQKTLVIDAKLACLLTKLRTELTKNHISEYMRIVSYERLKGVWERRHYPIVWYHDSWDSIDRMFLYDDQFNSDIVKRIIKSDCKSLKPVSILTKIFTDLNKVQEIKDLKEGNVVFNENNPAGLENEQIPKDRMSELHLVAICVNEKDEIFIAKRANKPDLPGLWEFGCAQLHLEETFVSAMMNSYKKDFGLTLKFCEKDPTPIGQYTFMKNQRRIVPGLIFVAKVESQRLNEEKADGTKHSEYKWITQETCTEIKPDDCVEDFHKRIPDVYRYLKAIEEKQPTFEITLNPRLKKI